MLGRDVSAHLAQHFLAVCERIATLIHPNVVPVEAYGEAGGRAYAALQFVDAPLLARVLAREGRLEPADALSIAANVADALDAARWSRGVAHGALSPRQIFVEPGADGSMHVLVAGFGLPIDARDGASAATRPVAEHAEYRSPEQLRGEGLTARTDVYTLGCLLYQCLTGEPPLFGTPPAELASSAAHDRPGLPRAVDDVIAKALADEPDERYSTCGELAVAVRGAFVDEGDGPVGEHAPVEQRTPVMGAAPTEPAEVIPDHVEPPATVDPGRPPSRTRASAALIAVAGVLAVAGAAVLLARDDPVDVGTPGAQAADEAPAEPPAATVSAEPAAPIDLATSTAATPPGLLVRVDASTRRVVEEIPIPFPTAATAGGNAVWVVGDARQAAVVFGVDPLSGSAFTAFDVPAGGAVALAAAGRTVWLGGEEGRVYRQTRGKDRALPTAVMQPDGSEINVGGPAIIAAAGSIWLSGFPAGPCCVPPPSVYRVSPGTRAVVAQFEGAGDVIAAGHGFVWAVVPVGERARAVRIDTETNTVQAVGMLPFWPGDVTVADGALWAIRPEGRMLVRLDAATGEVEARVRVSREIAALAEDGDAIWMTLPEADAVARYDIDSGRLRTVDVGGRPNDVVVAGGSAWVTVYETPPSLVDIRTGEQRSLPLSLAGGTRYAPSPDGTRVAYSTCRGPACSGTDRLVVASLDGTDVRTLRPPDGLNMYDPRWSPDGTKLVFQMRDGTNPRDVGELYVHDVATGELTQITDLRLDEARWPFLSPSFTADGEDVLFHLPRTSTKMTTFDVWSVPISGGEPTLLLGSASFPAWNPAARSDGPRIGLVEPAPPGPAGYRLALVGSIEGAGLRTTLVQGDGGITSPRFSPSGKRIAYEEDGWIYVVDGLRVPSRVAKGRSAEWLDGHTLIVAP